MIQWLRDISLISGQTSAAGDNISSALTKWCDVQALRQLHARLAGGRRKYLVTNSTFSGTYMWINMSVAKT